MILPTFHMFGMIRVFSERLSRFVRYSVAVGPRCFSIIGAMSSGPSALDDLVVFRALLTSSVVNRSLSVFSCLWIRLRFFLLILSLDAGCGVNCLLNSFVHRFALLASMPLNAMLTLLWIVVDVCMLGD